MTDVGILIRQAESKGATFTVQDADHVRVKVPDPFDDSLLMQLRQYKTEVIAYLKMRGYRLQHEGDYQTRPTRDEAEEIAARVEVEGYVLLWSTVLRDLVAFYRTDKDRDKIPAGFVPYSKVELEKLFGKTPISEHELKLVHEAKRQGVKVVGRTAKGNDGR